MEHSAPGRLDDLGKLLLRITATVLLSFHGYDKIAHGVGEVRAECARGGIPEAMAYGVYLGEVVAPLLILVGIYTRPAGIVYSGSILFATLLVHPRDYVSLAPTGGWAAELFIFYAAIGVAVALLGAGRFSLRGGRGRWD